MPTTLLRTFVGGKFQNGALTGAFSRLFNDVAVAGKYRSIIRKHNDLVSRIRVDYTKNPDASINLSKSDLSTITAYERYQAKNFGKSYTEDALGSGDPALSDTFIRGRYDNVMFNVEGYGSGIGGDVNYIGVGVSAEHYGISGQAHNFIIASYNLGQFVESGFSTPYNLRQIRTGSYWAEVGYSN